MNEKLTYCVAGHIFCIETPDRRLTSAILSNYAPFLVEEVDDKRVLFRLKGREEVDIPEITPSDTIAWNGVDYKMYHTPEGMLISMKKGDREHRLFARNDRKEMVCDLSLTDEGEAVFLNNLLRIAYGVTSIRVDQTIKIHGSVTELNGKAMIFLGKSGTGKSTLCSRLLGMRKNLRFSVSCTTRGIRAGEIHGTHYYFLSVEDFKKKIENDEFIEYAEVHGNFYGTLKSEVADRLSCGIDVLLEGTLRVRGRPRTARRPTAAGRAATRAT